MTKIKLVDLLGLEAGLDKIRQDLLRLGMVRELEDFNKWVDGLACIGFLEIAVNCVGYEMRRRKTTEERAISLVVSKIQDIAVSYNIKTSQKDRKELIEIVTKAYKEKSEKNNN